MPGTTGAPHSEVQLSPAPTHSTSHAASDALPRVHQQRTTLGHHPKGPQHSCQAQQKKVLPRVQELQPHAFQAELAFSSLALVGAVKRFGPPSPMTVGTVEMQDEARGPKAQFRDSQPGFRDPDCWRISDAGRLSMWMLANLKCQTERHIENSAFKLAPLRMLLCWL